MLFLENDIIENRYRVIEFIGKGGMSEVYLGYDIRVKRKVALKVLTKIEDNDPIAFKRFNQEIEIMSQISHPNIVEIIDYFLTKPYIIVLEFVKGNSLKKIIKKRAPFLLKEVIMITKQLLSAMIEIEENHIVHRDLKPQNIIITSSGLLKILDFGISLIGKKEESIEDKNIVGSVQYMSPETVRNKNISIKSDIYSIGIIIYEMLTGNVPFHSDESINVALMHIKKKVPSIKESSDAFHDDLDYIIKKATERDSTERYQSFKDFQKDFVNFANFYQENNMDLNRIINKSSLHKRKKSFFSLFFKKFK